MPGIARLATATTLLGIAGLHIAWGRGSTFPFPDREQLNDTVIGKEQTPNAAACYGVAALLTVAGAVVAGLPRRRSRLRRAAVAGVSAVLAARAALGFAGRTDLVSPGSVSPKFRRVDRALLAPLCLGLALGAARSLKD
jgi:hypothetical protein